MLRNSHETILELARAGNFHAIRELFKSGVIIEDYDQLISEIQLIGINSYPTIDLINRYRSSVKLYRQLIKQNLIPDDTRWEMKLSGAMSGVTLFLKSKNGKEKKVFLKTYNDPDFEGVPLQKELFNALNDYALFTILKKCGVSVPSVKLMGTEGSVYISSKDMGRHKKKRLLKEYYYFDLTAHSCVYKDESGCLETDINVFQQGHNNEESATKKLNRFFKYPFDKTSFARLLIMNCILNLGDVRYANIGVVISRDYELINAKVALVDFYTKPFCIYIPPNEHSISNYIESFGTISCEITTNFVQSYSESDYILAFQKINEFFIPACDTALTDIKGMSFESDVAKAEIAVTIETWKKNFTAFKGLVERAAINQPQASGRERKTV